MAETVEDDGVVVLAINAWDEPRQSLAAFAKEHNLKQRILLNGSDTAYQYHLSQMPTLVWINKAGQIADVAIGSKGFNAMLKKTRKLINAPL